MNKMGIKSVTEGKTSHLTPWYSLPPLNLSALLNPSLAYHPSALSGRYVLPEAGGDLLRDGAGVLPTGRNIHALDPYRMPR